MNIIKQKNTKSRLLFKIVLNALLLVLQIYLILNMTLSWFSSNKVIEAGQLDLRVYHSALPIYLNANFNDIILNKEYSDEGVTLTKTIIPGDVINFSVFADLTDSPGIEFVKISISYVPEWLAYIPGSADLFYAEIKEILLNDMITLVKTPCEKTVPPPHMPDNTEEGPYSFYFIIALPTDYMGKDGICLDFRLFFEDNDKNQNQHMNKTIRINFTAEEFNESLPANSE